MKTLIVYETLHGSAERCAGLLKEKINHETEMVRLRDNENLDISNYDNIIVGGSIHMGVIHTRVRDFVNRNLEALIEKPHGLYLCCMEQGETAKAQFNNAYPEELRRSSVINGLFGGEFLVKKMNLFERNFTKKVAKVNSTMSRINLGEIDKFARRISQLAD
jgi:menaquinone-dependent protoporphyrinogen oxidase